MKLIHSVLFISVFLFSCNRNSKTNNIKIIPHKTNSDTTVIDLETAGCLIDYYHSGFNNSEDSPGTLSKITYVYNSPKAGAKIIDTLPFNTLVNIRKDYLEYYLVCTPKNKSGYVKKTDLYLNRMYASSGSGNSYNYLIGVSKYSEDAKKEINSSTCETSELKIIKIDLKTSKKVDFYTDSITGSGYSIKALYNISLKNIGAIFHITYDCFQNIETDNDMFIIDNGKKISCLIKARSGGDGGDADGTTVYLPVTLQEGKKVVLAKNGELTLDPTTAKPELHTYPINCGIPINQLIVVDTWSEEDADLTQKYNTDGTAYTNTTITSTDLYRWGGNTLTKVKTIIGKTEP